jgi:dihydroxy-acid dehydratase
MGMSLVGCGTALAGSSKKRRIAFDSGKRVVELVKENITPRSIMTKEAFHNAVLLDLALGGSTNTVLHLPAIAYEAGIELSLDMFDDMSRKIPHITCLEPAGDYFMEDLDKAGGISAVLSVLKDDIKNNKTVSGVDTKEIANAGFVEDTDIIRTKENAYHKEGGIAILRGNIAPDGAVVKQSAVKENMMKFKGSAVVFDGEEEAMRLLSRNK